MKYLLLILGMLFFHLIDDYYLQGWLASAKQKSWWENNAPDKLYKNDYMCALIEHAFSWTCMIHIPVVIFLYLNMSLQKFNSSIIVFLILFVINWVIHAMIDNMKANRKLINLCQDQAFHLVQIILTGMFWICAT